MANWKYKLNSGTTLREAIQDDDSRETLLALKKCYKELNSLLPDNIYNEDKMEEDLYEAANQLDNLDNYADYDMTEEDCENEINFLLSRFYDFCDSNGVWVNIA